MTVGAWQQFNPVTGELILNHAELLPASVASASLLPVRLDAENVRPVIVMDSTFAVHLLPPKPVAALLADANSNVYRFIQNDLFLSMIYQPAQKGPVLIAGCKPQISSVNNGTVIQCDPVWSHELSSSSEFSRSSRIIAVASKSSHEVAHSDARIIADEKLLYKYINPNLLLVILEVRDLPAAHDEVSALPPTSKSLHGNGTVLHVLCLDLITGQVLVSNVHKRASGPVAAVVSENFVVYTYWSERMRNTEVSVMDFYLGERKLAGTHDEYARAFRKIDSQITADGDANNKVMSAIDYYSRVSSYFLG